MKLKDKVAIITGASKGIGRAIAELFAAEGAALALCSRSEGDIMELGRRLVADKVIAKEKLFLATCDVAVEKQVDAFVGKAASKFGRIDALVNNAGDPTSAPLLKMDAKFWDRIISVNLTGVYLMMKASLRVMIPRKEGRIINIASISGKFGGKYISAYSAAKHGVLGLTKSAAIELSEHGITVCAVCPGYVNTPSTNKNIQTIMDRTGMTREEVLRFMRKRNKSGRIIEAAEVAAKVLKLATARDSNGKIVDIW